MAILRFRFSERPELWDRIVGLSAEVWPEYNRHGDVLNRYWDRLYPEFPDYQFVLYDESADEVLAEGHTIPVAWSGVPDDLGPGIDASIVAGFHLRETGAQPTALCALAAEIPPRHRRRGLAPVLLAAMADIGRAAGLPALIAPVRPSWKERYPLTPIDRYVRWVRADGAPLDPWIRVHTGMGAAIGPALPESMRITGSVHEWEAWTGMAFPESDRYVFPGGLAVVDVDREKDLGAYWEPNVWLMHTLG
ncbi:MAG TPA: hypothetical protein VFA11_17310 [Acidimicrobiales bacterium]|nr:hypothetical protein [Acidimicrobiales bacterium]